MNCSKASVCRTEQLRGQAPACTDVITLQWAGDSSDTWHMELVTDWITRVMVWPTEARMLTLPWYTAIALVFYNTTLYHMENQNTSLMIELSR